MRYALCVENLEKSYSRFRLDKVSLALPEGHGMELVGENGSGKTTFIKAVLGLADAKAEKIEIFGRPPDAAAEDIGVVLKGTKLPGPFTVKDLAYIHSKAYKRFDMEFFRSLLNRFGVGLGAKIGSLSSDGNACVLAILALSHHPRLLVLDEAADILSEESALALEDVVGDMMKEGSLSLLHAVRSPGALGGLCDMVALLCDGSLVLCGSKAEILSKHRILDLTSKELASVNRRKLIGPRRLKDSRTRALVETKDFKGKSCGLREPLLAEVLFHFSKREETRR